MISTVSSRLKRVIYYFCILISVIRKLIIYEYLWNAHLFKILEYYS